MKKILCLLAIATAIVTTNSAQAKTRLSGPQICRLDFAAIGGSAQAIVGVTLFGGEGVIRCSDIIGQTEELYVDIKIANQFAGLPIGIGVGYGVFAIEGSAVNIGVINGPESLLGKYTMVNANAAFIGGAGANVAVHGAKNSLAFNLGLNVEAGFGIQIGLNKLTITKSKKYAQANSENAEF